jgi:hypothetical protein
VSLTYRSHVSYRAPYDYRGHRRPYDVPVAGAAAGSGSVLAAIGGRGRLQASFGGAATVAAQGEARFHDPYRFEIDLGGREVGSTKGDLVGTATRADLVVGQ